MRWAVFAFAAIGLVAAACANATGLSQQPRATFNQIACLEKNGDGTLNGGDAADVSQISDINGDGKRDANDAAFLQGIDIPLNVPAQVEACGKNKGRAAEWAVARGYFEPAKVSCESADAKAVLLVGVGGGVANIKNKEDAAGVRSMIDGLQKAYDKRGYQTIAVLAGPAMLGAANLHSAMEEWMTNAVKVYLDRYPCLRVLMLGHSNGAITVDVAAARLEGAYASRIVEVVDVDRIDVLYTGDTQSRPQQVRVFNIYETNDPILKGKPYDSPNVENWDASGEPGPKNGEDGGPLQPVNHTIIDNSASVKQRIIDQAMALP